MTESSLRTEPSGVRLAAIVGAGAVGGALAGIGEGLWVIGLGTDWESDYRFLLVAAVLYTLIGIGVAIPLAAVLWLLRRRWTVPAGRQWALGLGWTVAAFVVVLFRFRYQRDIAHEVPLSVLGNGAFALGGVAVAALVFALAPPLLRRARLSPAAASAVLWLGLVASAWALTGLLPRSGTSEYRAAATTVPGRPSILYIMVDTLRADHTSPYGGPAGEHPGMEMLARDGVLFEKAMSQAPWTRPSVATQLTSWPPHRHGARFKSGSISPQAVSMVEVMNRAGYYCAGLYSNQHVGVQWGFGRGYHRYLPPPKPGWPGLSLSMMGLRAIANVVPGLGAGTPGAKTPRYFAQAREMLTNPPHGAPLFLYLHFMDPHDPYRPHGSRRPSIRRADAENPGPAVAEMFRQAYRDEIRYFDGHLREFLEWLRSAGLYDDLLIVLVSDHGEEFFEHGGYWHGLTLYEEQLHVPLIVKLPGNRFGGSRQASMVRLLDVAPTIAAVAGLELPDVWMGRPLLGPTGPIDPLVEEAASETDLEGGGLRALRGRRHKLVLAQERTSRNVPRRSLFDLESDPGESRDRSAEDPEHARQLEQALIHERAGDLWR